MVGRRVEIARPPSKDISLSDLPAICLEEIKKRPRMVIELPLKPRSHDGARACNKPDKPVDHAVAGLAEAHAAMSYKIAKVPSCFVTPSGMPGSIVYPILQRSQWEAQTNELLALCHEAAERRALKTGVFRGIHHDHAEAERMSLAFIQDRIDTDDPIRGYTVRTDDAQRRMQGFIWFTTFTTWTHFFKWDSKSSEAGLRGHADRHGVRWDSENALAWELEQQERAGDPRAEGVIWPRVGEVSLVGGLGCGGFLLQLALEEMEARGAYDYAVVQATESSAGFYDRMGFVRVGALARYVPPGEDYLKAKTVAYRHFAGPDEKVEHLDSSIMMAIRLRPGMIPRRVLCKHGGIYQNLGSKVAVCLEHAGEATESVNSTTPNSPAEDMSKEASPPPPSVKERKAPLTPQRIRLEGERLIGAREVIGPGAPDMGLKALQFVIGWEEGGEEMKDGKDGDDGRELRRAGEFAKRRLSLWLSPKEANRSWELYGTPAPVDEAVVASGVGVGRGGGRRRRGRGRGRRPSRESGRWADSPERTSAEETPVRIDRKRKKAGSGWLEGDIATRVLEGLHKETLRVVCADFALQISGPKSVLVGRVEAIQETMEGLGVRGWLDHDAVKVATLELVCQDLGLYKRGAKEDLRARVFEFGQEAVDPSLSPLSTPGCQSELGGGWNGEEMSLQMLKLDTLRLVCFDLGMPFSGAKHMLIERILRQVEALRAGVGWEGDEGESWWPFQAGVKLPTLQSACVDLGLNKTGNKPHLQHRILEWVRETTAPDIEEHVDEAPAAKVPRKRGRPRKIVVDDQEVCSRCMNTDTPPADSYDKGTAWDAVACSKRDAVKAAVLACGKPLGMAGETLGVAVSGRERKLVQKYRPRLGV